MSYCKILQGDCREQLRNIADASIDSIVTDPPYELGFMNRKWDSSGIAYDITVWRECLRVLKPGGHLLSFGGTRTYHRMTCAIEDVGFEIRDCIMWVYGSGFPKSHDVSKAIDKAAGAEREVIGISQRHGGGIIGNGTSYEIKPTIPPITAPATEAAKQWQGWGSALKPAVEPIVVARKPLDGTIADNVLRHGTGGINIDGCRVATTDKLGGGMENGTSKVSEGWDRPWRTDAEAIERNKAAMATKIAKAEALGRWPANLIHDGSEEVVGLFPQANHRTGGASSISIGGNDVYKGGKGKAVVPVGYGDSGSAARFFYCAKTSPSERGDNSHPTVKPLALMRYLCRLVTPPQGVVLDPFAGSGSTLVAARAEGFSAIGCELEAAHIDIIKRRLDLPIESAEEQPREEKQQDGKKTSIQLKLF